MTQRKFSERRAFFFGLAILGIPFFSVIVMLLWNAILPEVANVTRINFWQALGILVLSKILFGGFRGGWHGRRNHWRRQMQEKWAAMSPEEKEKFKQEWQSRCGGWWYERKVGSQESGVGSQQPGAVPQAEGLK